MCVSFTIPWYILWDSVRSWIWMTGSHKEKHICHNMPQIIATSTQKIYWYILKILIGLSRFLPQASCNVLQHPGKDGGQRAKRAKLDPQSLRILCERRRVRSSKAWDMMINMNRHPAVPLPMTNGNFIRNSRSFVQSSSFSGAVPFFFRANGWRQPGHYLLLTLVEPQMTLGAFLQMAIMLWHR